MSSLSCFCSWWPSCSTTTAFRPPSTSRRCSAPTPSISHPPTSPLTFLIVQFVAFGGAYFFGWLSARTDIRRAILINLSVWVLVAIGAFLLPEGNALAFQGLGVVIGLILGGIQALSRSLYGSMIPEEASAEFYGFYSVFSKFSAIWGPIIFAIVASLTDSGRPAILSIVLFFGLGMFLFSKVDIEEARRSKDRWDIHGIEVTTGGP